MSYLLFPNILADRECQSSRLDIKVFVKFSVLWETPRLFLGTELILLKYCQNWDCELSQLPGHFLLETSRNASVISNPVNLGCCYPHVNLATDVTTKACKIHSTCTSLFQTISGNSLSSNYWFQNLKKIYHTNSQCNPAAEGRVNHVLGSPRKHFVGSLVITRTCRRNLCVTASGLHASLRMKFTLKSRCWFLGVNSGPDVGQVSPRWSAAALHWACSWARHRAISWCCWKRESEEPLPLPFFNAL